MPPKTLWLLVIVAALVHAQGATAAGKLPLVDAAKRGDVAAVRALLPKADVNATEVDGSTAVHWAVYGEQSDTLELLLRAGADVKVANRYGVTPLSLACIKGNAAIVERLLRAGADPNAALAGGETPLMTAARTGKADAVRALVAHGAHVDQREQTRGQTALMWAAAEGNAATARVLIEAGADINLRATGPSKKFGDEGGAYKNMLGKRLDQLTPLLFAARRGQQDTVRMLLDAGAHINDRGPDGSSAVSLAIANANYDVTMYLLDRGADPTMATDGWTALHQLMRARRPSLGRVMAPVGFDSPAALAVAKKLIERGADVNARMTKDVADAYRHTEKREGATPYFLAAKGADAPMMRLLLSHGANPRMPTDDGTTPLMVAAGYGDFAPDEAGTPEDAIAAVKAALEATGGDDVNTANNAGWTPLHAAAHKGSNAIIQLLAEKGARLDAKTEQGFTALGVASGWSSSGPSGNYGDIHTQVHTVALLKQMMSAKGLSTEGAANLGWKVRLEP